VLFLLFFFSSRRRHTISKRDWSSVVCSSGLISRFRRAKAPAMMTGAFALRNREISDADLGADPNHRALLFIDGDLEDSAVGTARSEERRVGTEGGARGAGEGERRRERSGRWQ